MAAKGMQDAFNKELGFLDAITPQHTDQSYYDYLNNAGALNSKIAGLYNSGSYNNAMQGFDKGLSDYETRINDLYNNAGYTDEEKQGQKRAVEAGFSAPYADAANQMKLNQVRTGNSAGVASNIAKLGREKGQMVSAGLGGLEKGFGDARMSGQQQAVSLSQFPQQARLQRMQGERDVAGIQQGQGAQALQAYGTGLSGLLNTTQARAGNIASNPGFLKQLGSGLAGALGNTTGTFKF